LKFNYNKIAGTPIVSSLGIVYHKSLVFVVYINTLLKVCETQQFNFKTSKQFRENWFNNLPMPIDIVIGYRQPDYRKRIRHGVMYGIFHEFFVDRGYHVTETTSFKKVTRALGKGHIGSDPAKVSILLDKYPFIEEKINYESKDYYIKGGILAHIGLTKGKIYMAYNRTKF